MFNMKSLCDLHPILFSTMVGESDRSLELVLVLVNEIVEHALEDELCEEREREPSGAVAGERRVDHNDRDNQVDDDVGILRGVELVGDAFVKRVLDEPDSEDVERRDQDQEDDAPEALEGEELDEEPACVVVDRGFDLEPEEEDEADDGFDLMDKECY